MSILMHISRHYGVMTLTPSLDDHPAIITPGWR